MKKSKIAAVLSFAVLSAGAAHAGTFTWTGTAGDGNWFTTGNWSPNGSPAAGDSATVAGGDTANIDSTLTDTGGTILATGTGSAVDIAGTITGGTLNTASGGVIAGNGGTLINVTNEGTLTFNGSFFYLQGTIDNTGVIESDPNAANTYLSYPSGQTTTLMGGGSVLLNSSGSNLYANGAGGFDNQDNLIHGYGNIQSLVTNSGTVSADSNGNTLALNGNPITNTSTGSMQATNGGTLLIGTTVTGGTLSTSTGGVITGNGSGTLNNLTNAGILTYNGSFLYLEGTINNTGTIQPDSTTDNSYLTYTNGQTTTLTGGGAILLNKSNAYIYANGSGGFINQNNLIHGFGHIEAPLTNNGIINADSSGNTLALDGSPVTNSGTLEATSGGILLIGTTITGGTLNTSTGGEITGNGSGVLNNLINAGTLTFNGSFLYLEGTIDNTGVIESDNTVANSYLSFVSNQTATLTGGGSVLLNNSGAHLYNNGPGGFTNQDNLIHGYGDIQSSLTNNATVSADSTGNTLTLDSGAITNNGTLQAINAGNLNLNSSITNTTGVILANGTGSTVSIGSSGFITGGTLKTTNGGVIAGNGGTLNGVTNNGTVTFNGSFLYLQGTIDNTGVIESDPNAANTYLSYPSGQTTTLMGGGSVLLNSSGSNLYANGAGGFDNQDNLIHGYGNIQSLVTNSGTVSADSNGNTLALNGNPITNTSTGSMQATNGGTLLIGTTVTGGTLSTSTGGVITGNGSGTLNNLTNAGILTYNGSFLYLEGTINNTGTIQPDSTTDNSYLTYTNGQTTTLTGGGAILLNKSNAFIYANGSGGFINQNNLIHGFGHIEAPLTNNGIINADSSGDTLTVSGAPTMNNASFQAIDGGILEISSTTLTQGTGGNVVAGNATTGGTVEVTNSATISGGTVGSTGSGVFNVVYGTLSSVTIPSARQVNVPVSDFLTYTSLTNNGALTVAGSATGGGLSGSGTLSIASTGLVQFSSGSGLSQQGALTITGNGVLNINNNHLIINYGATDPVATIYSYLQTGYSNGNWSGPGIDSSTASSNSAHYGVGFVDGADHIPGASVTSGQIEIAYALYGDVNLDGLVNATDFAVFGANFNKSITGWDHGDFTYTGLVNGTDFALLGENFGKSASGVAISLPQSDYAALDAFAAANGLSLPNVPEPATSMFAGVVAFGILMRRCRRTPHLA